MKIKELNKIQKNAMSKELIKEHYEWEDKRLFSYILGEVPKERELYRYSGKELSGEELEQKYQVKYLYTDLKKKNGYKRSIELSHEYNLYRQDYCGCIYSKVEHDKRVSEN